MNLMIIMEIMIPRMRAIDCRWITIKIMILTTILSDTMTLNTTKMVLIRDCPRRHAVVISCTQVHYSLYLSYGSRDTEMHHSAAAMAGLRLLKMMMTPYIHALSYFDFLGFHIIYSALTSVL